MAELTWGNAGERFFEAGVDHGVIYPTNGQGVAWNGLVNITQKSSGGGATPLYFNGVKYQNDVESEDFEATIEAFTYPDAFAECEGTVFDEEGLGYGMQPRKWFNLSYRTLIGNDLQGVDYGYKLHFIYNALALPSDKSHSSLSDGLDPSTFSWDITTIPELIPNRKATAYLVVDTRKTNEYVIAEIERILYGSEDSEARFIYPAELIKMVGWEMFRITPQPVSGLTQLVTADDPDLKGNTGLYYKTVETNLTESPFPGLYTLEP